MKMGWRCREMDGIGARPSRLTRRRAVAKVAIGAIVALVFGTSGVFAATALADNEAVAGNGELQPIQADQARPALPPSPATEIHYLGQTISAMAYLVRVDAPAAHAASNTEETTVIAYSLDLQAGPAGAGVWAAASPGTPGIADLRSASYVAGLGTSSDLADTGRELAARQIAIWHYTNGLPIDSGTVPDPIVRRRALTVAKAAATGRPPGGTNPISVGITANLADVEPSRITIGVLLSINSENSYCSAQKLDIRFNGHWGVVKTGAITNLGYSGPNQLKSTRTSALAGAPCNGGPARDFNQALFTLPRPQVGTRLEIDWNISLTGVNVFENGSAPPLLVVGGNEPNLEYRQVLPLDPSTFPTAHNYLDRFLTNLMSTFHGIWAILLLLLLLGLAPTLRDGLRELVVGGGRLAARTARTRISPSRPEPPTGPRQEEPGNGAVEGSAGRPREEGAPESPVPSSDGGAAATAPSKDAKSPVGG
jgi:hypothetical protein